MTKRQPWDMSGSQSPDEPTTRLPNTSQSEPKTKLETGTTTPPKPGETDSQATVWDAAAQPTQRLDPGSQPTQQLDPSSQPTQQLDPSNQPTQRMDSAYPTELLGAQEPPGYLPPPVLAPPNPSTRSGAYPVARWFHGATAFMAWAALALQLVLVVQDVGLDEKLLPAIVNYLSSFTILGIVVVALVTSALAMNPIRQTSSFGPFRLDSVVVVTMSTLIYLFVEVSRFAPQGWQIVADISFYYVVPLLALVGYGLFGPRPRFRFGDLLPALVIPAVWVVYTLLHGALASWYPYSFMNAETLGYDRVAVNVAWMFVVLVLLSVGFILLDKKLPWAPRR